MHRRLAAGVHSVKEAAAIVDLKKENTIVCATSAVPVTQVAVLGAIKDAHVVTGAEKACIPQT